MARNLVLMMLSISIGSCAPGRASQASTQAQTGSSSPSIVLAVGQAGRVAGTPVTVRFEGVVEDSRCPEGVACVWAGDVSVKLQLEGGQASPKDATLQLNRAPHDAVLGDHRVTLVSVAPYPKDGEKIEPTTYRATMRVDKR